MLDFTKTKWGHQAQAGLQSLLGIFTWQYIVDFKFYIVLFLYTYIYVYSNMLFFCCDTFLILCGFTAMIPCYDVSLI